jgi:DNA-binding transcriptional LysR family regulator
MNREIDWALWRSFLAVADTGSLSAAARQLGLTQPTLGRQIAALETALGRRLFVKSQAGYALADGAAALLEEARAMHLSAAALARMASARDDAGDLAGVVRIAASHVVGAEVLPHALAPLLAGHPRLEVELALSNSAADLLRREADIALRMVRPAQSTLVARKLADVPLGLFAHRAYLDRAGSPAQVADLARHVLIGPDRDPTLQPILAALGPGFTRNSLRLRVDEEAAQLGAMRAGLGIAICQRGIAVREDALVEVLPGAFGHALECWQVIHADLRDAPRIRAVADHLARTLPALFAGRIPDHNIPGTT